MRHVLVANRGEIAVRILRTARALGLRTTAVYSEADATAAHVSLADAAVLIGPPQVSASYLNTERIVAAARRVGADAVHPGYGLLSENPAFARACQAAGLCFIGPAPETIELMGNKGRARIAMHAAGVPCVPGYDGADQSDATLLREATTLGFPLMVKAAAGGGGRGMRRVTEPAALPEAIARARSEAQSGFGDGRLILERAIDGARHVEIQVFADAHSNVIHLGERDCSVQRRFQKVIEEAPSPAVGAELRARMGAVAVLAARRSGYLGAGTVELLLAPDGSFYFLEMNTRLQVEHPVTEALTGLDLVEWQFRIAQGEALPLTQADVHLHGHAIEARLYAEDPAHGFVPQTGTIARLVLPSGQGVRIDHWLAPGQEISAHYDPLLAKIIAHGVDREQARLRLIAALAALRVLGLRTNQAFLGEVLAHETFASGAAATDFLDRHFVHQPSAAPTTHALVAAALCFLKRAPTVTSYATETEGFTNCVGLGWPMTIEVDEQRHELRVTPDGRCREYRVRVGEVEVLATLAAAATDSVSVVVDGVRLRFDFAWVAEQLWLHTPAGPLCLRDVTHAASDATQARGSGRALAPMDGSVVDVPVRPGDSVTRGQTLAVVEAMKLELRIAADMDGVVHAVHVQRGDQVKARQLLVELQAMQA
ncbi:MAG TPA: biotin carboxylase N-terminal domain-containing protein [Polyangiales bacterium]